jgi:hypothetical protein
VTLGWFELARDLGAFGREPALRFINRLVGSRQIQNTHERASGKSIKRCQYLNAFYKEMEKFNKKIGFLSPRDKEEH